MSRDLEARVEELTARLEQLETERAVLDLLYRYGHCIDYGDDEGWLDCFTKDAVFDVQARDPEGQRSHVHGAGEVHHRGVRYAGPVALRSFIETHTSAPEAYHKHFLVEPRISVARDGKTARVQSYFARLDDRNGKRVIWAFGRYIDELMRCSDGRWRFERRTAEVESL